MAEAMADARAGTAAGASTPEHLLRRLEWTVLRRLDGLLQGDYRTLLRGGGIDLADLREYQYHDDVRHIDWNVTARLQQPYVREFLEDRDLTAWFLLDLSGSVDFGSAGITKRAVSTAFVAALARLVTRRGNRVGALLYGTRVDAVLPPAATRLHVLRLLQMMRLPRAGAAKAAGQRSRREAGRPAGGTGGAAGAASAAGARRGDHPARHGDPRAGATGTRLVELLDAAAGIVKRRSLVFVVSDFISEPGWEAALGRLARRHEVVAVRLVDPAEMALPDVGLVTVEDAETGEQLFIDAADPTFRARYAAIAEAGETRLIEALGASGADILELATDDDLLEALLRFVDLRRQRARRKALPRAAAALPRARTVPAAPSLQAAGGQA